MINERLILPLQFRIVLLSALIVFLMGVTQMIAGAELSHELRYPSKECRKNFVFLVEHDSDGSIRKITITRRSGKDTIDHESDLINEKEFLLVFNCIAPNTVRGNFVDEWYGVVRGIEFKTRSYERTLVKSTSVRRGNRRGFSEITIMSVESPRVRVRLNFDEDGNLQIEN